MIPEHNNSEHVLLSGADYLDTVIADLVAQEEKMVAHAAATDITSVKDGYLKFAAVLHHCADTLKAKSAELRMGHNA